MLMIKRLQILSSELPSDYLCFISSLGFSMPIISFVISSQWPWYELQPTKSDLENDIVYVKQEYYESNDRCSWMMHEIGHFVFYKCCGRVLDDDYPRNGEELFSFGLQFLYLKNKGLKKVEILSMIGQSYSEEEERVYSNVFSEIWEKTDEKYLISLIVKYKKEDAENPVKSRRHNKVIQ